MVSYAYEEEANNQETPKTPNLKPVKAFNPMKRILESNKKTQRIVLLVNEQTYSRLTHGNLGRLKWWAWAIFAANNLRQPTDQEIKEFAKMKISHVENGDE